MDREKENDAFEKYASSYRTISEPKAEFIHISPFQYRKMKALSLSLNETGAVARKIFLLMVPSVRKKSSIFS